MAKLLPSIARRMIAKMHRQIYVEQHASTAIQINPKRIGFFGRFFNIHISIDVIGNLQ